MTHHRSGRFTFKPGRRVAWFLAAMLFAFCSLLVFADEDVEEITIPVATDANLMPQQTPDGNVYWIDGDGSHGQVVLQFRSPRLADRPVCDELLGTDSLLRLTVSVPNVENAESDDGFDVFSDGVLVGSATAVQANTRVRVELDPCLVPHREEITLLLTARGTDGVAVSPMRTGAGAQLDLIIFHPRQIGVDVEEEIPLEDATTRYLSANSERNIVSDGRPGTDFYWIDGDENHGKLELTFEPGTVFSRSTPDVFLVLTIPDVDWAGSSDGLRVIWRGSEIGRLEEAERDSVVEIPLSFDVTRPQDPIELLLENTGDDGIAVAASRTGDGPRLKVVIREPEGR